MARQRGGILHARRKPGVVYVCWSCDAVLTGRDKEPVCRDCKRDWLGRKPNPRNGLNERGEIRGS